jgi:hypothetical protein
VEFTGDGQPPPYWRRIKGRVVKRLCDPKSCIDFSALILPENRKAAISGDGTKSWSRGSGVSCPEIHFHQKCIRIGLQPTKPATNLAPSQGRTGPGPTILLVFRQHLFNRPSVCQPSRSEQDWRVHDTIPTIKRPDEADDFVRARIAEGADYIKIVYEPDGPGMTSISDETLRSLIQAAHAHGKMAIVHTLSIKAAREAVDAVSSTRRSTTHCSSRLQNGVRLSSRRSTFPRPLRLT